MESSDGEGIPSSFDAAANDNLGFFLEAFLSLVGVWEFRGEDFLEDCLLCVVGFDVFATESAGYEGGLVLFLANEKVGTMRDVCVRMAYAFEFE